ncbi:MAG TPA: hypothetical protein ENG12_02270 [Candidatus Altiarchaeales archaeon]|nr:MAG: hypothetical protein B6U86_03235 [Candidatus Altiarchaeales archaeon ex4484_43]HDH41218.1 hypothetical protein [Candidatus Altiarchaeales archaeon]
MDQKKTDATQNGNCEMNYLDVDIHVPSEVAEVCYRAIEMETKSRALHRSKITLSHTRNLLSLRIIAKDLTALRGSMNTYLRWIGMCLNLTKD